MGASAISSLPSKKYGSLVSSPLSIASTFPPHPTSPKKKPFAPPLAFAIPPVNILWGLSLHHPVSLALLLCSLCKWGWEGRIMRWAGRERKRKTRERENIQALTGWLEQTHWHERLDRNRNGNSPTLFLLIHPVVLVRQDGCCIIAKALRTPSRHSFIIPHDSLIGDDKCSLLCYSRWYYAL